MADRWIIGPLIGRGSTGQVYRGKDKDTEELVAIKLGNDEYGGIEFEKMTYEKMWRASSSIPGIPKMLHFGPHGKQKVLVMSHLGPDVEKIRVMSGGKLSMKSVLMIGVQVLKRLEKIHGWGIIHRDMKPDNLLMGSTTSSTVYLIDFGVSSSILDKSTGGHIAMKSGNKRIIGTPEFASIASHEGNTMSRRDDLQSLGYVLVYLAKGCLPWSRKERSSKILKKKKTIDIMELGQGLPGQVSEYLSRVNELRFEERPDYEALRDMLESALRENDGEHDGQFGWVTDPSIFY